MCPAVTASTSAASRSSAMRASFSGGTSSESQKGLCVTRMHGSSLFTPARSDSSTASDPGPGTLSREVSHETRTTP